MTVPDGCGFLSYKAVGSTGRISDGEEGYLPVLSRRILVTESLPLPIRGPATKKFEFTKLLAVGRVEDAQEREPDRADGLEPAWYAVMALPYLMEYPYECTRAGVQPPVRQRAGPAHRQQRPQDPPRLRPVEGDAGPGQPAGEEPGPQVGDARGDALVCQAQGESQARRQRGHPVRRQPAERARRPALLRKLAEMQLSDGAWPWFPGGRANDYITLYITTGFGRLRHLGVKIDTGPAVKSLDAPGRLDRPHLPGDPQARPQGGQPPVARRSRLYLYGRSFFLDDKPIDAKHTEAVDYFLGQARKYWLDAGLPPVAGPPGRGPEALRRQGDRPGHHAVDQGAQRHQRGNGHVLARHRALLVVVPGARSRPRP